MSQSTRDYKLSCRKCGEAGLLSITSGMEGWSFGTAGFIGLAVSRANPAASIIRCNACHSMDVGVAPDPDSSTDRD